MRLRARIERALAPSFIDRVERDHTQPPPALLRRRIAVAITLAVGAVLLGISLSITPGHSSFYILTGAVAATWVIGGFLSGPIHLGYITFRGSLRRPLLTPVAIGLAVAAIFVAGALVVREIPAVRDYVDSVLAHVRYGSLPLIVVVTVANGVAEEIFFRGALFAAIGRAYPVPISTLIYTIATLATGNPMLSFAALTVGFVLGLQRRASGGVLAPLITHVTWSTAMLFALPPLFPH